MKLQILTKAGASLMALLFGGTALFLKVPPIYGYACIGLGALFTGDLVICVCFATPARCRSRND